MAGAKSGVHVVQLKPISVPKNLLDGNKFIKWDDDSTTATPVTLKVDTNGFFLYWTDQNKETEFLEISSIRDIRTGKFARIPKEGKLRDAVTMGQDFPLEEKTVTVLFGPDFVNITFLNFCCIAKDIALEWTDALMKMAHNLLALNAPTTSFLEKLYTKIQLIKDREGKVPVKNVVKLFAQNKEDKKRVEKALELCGVATGKNETILPEKFTFEDFLSFYRCLTGREEVDAIFEKLTGGKKKSMTVDQLVEFLNKEQRDPRLNEILYPYADPARVREIIKQYEPNQSFAQKGLMSVDGFLRYLMGADNVIVAPEKFDLNSDMDQPLSHYFINSSHNTYLTGHQLTGKSSVEIYRQCLLSGCRCLELDCWNGKGSDEEPIITHGYTVVTEIPLKEVLEAIAESAFKTSDYPVLLSFENHCSQKQQEKMANYCCKIFGDLLVTEPLPNFELKPDTPLPSPNQFLRRILIKNKKKHYPKSITSNKSHSATDKDDDAPQTTPEKTKLVPCPSDDKTGRGNITNGNNERLDRVPSEMDDSGSDSGSEEEEAAEQQVEDQNEGTAAKESEAGAEMSALVIYTQPVRFHSFEHAEKRNRAYELSSVVETQATNLLKEHPVEFVNYNKKQLTRVYPKGTRVDSSNVMPQVFWNAGCQLVCLNFQTLDLGMQLNMGIFEYNGRSGYLLKPHFMRRKDRKFDPFTESTVDGIIAGTVTIKVISGQLLTDKRVGTYVEVDMYGLPADTVRRRFRTKTVQNNGINPTYDEEPFVFKKVVLPDLASLRIAVYEDGGKFIGHRVLPVVGLRPGYRHISLRNESGQPLQLHTLFVHITVKDYIPDGFSELADALANPIAYQSIMEKHACQLMALTDDDENIDQSEKDSGRSPAKLSLGSDSGRQSSSREDSGKPDSRGSSRHNTVNGNIQRMPSGSTSPAAMPPALKRQETLRRGLAQSVRSLSDENAQEKIPSLLESEEANLTAESLDQIREHKSVQKVMAKLEKELHAIRKKHDKLKDKERDLLLQKEEKLSKAQEHQKSHITKTHSKLVKKSSGIDVQLLKKKSDAGIMAMAVDHHTKMEELHQKYSQTVISLTTELYKSELELHDRFQDQLYGAMDKSLLSSQSAQMDHLKSLHDREVAELMKRLELQNKEEMKDLSKKHKDKNELARIKRESHQRLIEQAVAERQRFSSLLDKRKTQLERQHLEIKKLLEEEKNTAHDRLQQDFQCRLSKLREQPVTSPVSPACDRTAL